MLGEHYVLGEAPLIAPPPVTPVSTRRPESTEIYFFDKEMAQAFIRIESASDVYSELRRPFIQLYDEYFYGGMAGIVFQEMREARALAYSAWSHLFIGEHKTQEDFFGAFFPAYFYSLQ